MIPQMNKAMGLAARPSSQIESELSELTMVHKDLIETCNRLKLRLASVLRQGGLTAELDPSGPTPIRVPLAESLAEITSVTRQAISILSDIEQSVELPFAQ